MTEKNIKFIEKNLGNCIVSLNNITEKGLGNETITKISCEIGFLLVGLEFIKPYSMRVKETIKASRDCDKAREKQKKVTK